MNAQLLISKENLLHNLRILKEIAGTKIAAVVKANAYGHGLNQVVSILEDHVDYFQVDNFEELLQLRKTSNKEALVFGYISKDELAQLYELNAIPGFYNLESINNYDGEYHLKIDALFGRQGVLTADLPSMLKKIKNRKMTGVYTHFSKNKRPKVDIHTQEQVADFKKALSLLKQFGFTDLEIHTNATAGVLNGNDLPNTISRLGTGLYGYSSVAGVELDLRPVLSWKSHIAQIKEIPEGFSVGYGGTFISRKKMKIAVIPQGYSDGFDRRFSNNGSVLIKGVLCKVIGAVSMNMIVVDVSDVATLAVEDEVTLLSSELDAKNLAESLGTIPYEVLARIPSSKERIIV